MQEGGNPALNDESLDMGKVADRLAEELDSIHELIDDGLLTGQ